MIFERTKDPKESKQTLVLKFVKDGCPMKGEKSCQMKREIPTIYTRPTPGDR